MKLPCRNHELFVNHPSQSDGWYEESNLHLMAGSYNVIAISEDRDNVIW
jgi:hypothetical protein